MGDLHFPVTPVNPKDLFIPPGGADTRFLKSLEAELVTMRSPKKGYYKRTVNIGAQDFYEIIRTAPGDLKCSLAPPP